MIKLSINRPHPVIWIKNDVQLSVKRTDNENEIELNRKKDRYVRQTPLRHRLPHEHGRAHDPGRPPQRTGE
ncbi:hypothetical protein SDC9_144563 [bioreactor metagenome]|uniref:Uncharacterized protein n=1 Tax=bioreactor metagenome TaxID=1076179 RepID=A0A645E6G2_9ZZZZ